MNLLKSVDARPLATTGCKVRRTFVASTGQIETISMPQRFTSWEAIYSSLRSAFPDHRYHSGNELTLEAQSASGGNIWSGNDRIEADLLIAADGIRSRFRAALAPDTITSYSGYVAWRGVVNESELDPDLIEHFDDTFSFCQATGGGHALCYFIPGSDLATERGKRRLNWVWYIHVDHGPALDRLLTDKSGRRRDTSVPQGEISDNMRDFLLARTGALTEAFARLVEATPDPFLQSIIDVVPSGMVFGRVCLIGDAAFVLRPHAAAAAAKAAADAMALAHALRNAEGDFDHRLSAWARQRTAIGRQLVNYGVMLGDRAKTSPVRRQRTP